jgi:hypothetical protein
LRRNQGLPVRYQRTHTNTLEQLKNKIRYKTMLNKNYKLIFSGSNKNKTKFFLSFKEQFKYLKTAYTFYLVDQSPWPLITSLDALMLTRGLVLGPVVVDGTDYCLITSTCNGLTLKTFLPKGVVSVCQNIDFFQTKKSYYSMVTPNGARLEVDVLNDRDIKIRVKWDGYGGFVYAFVGLDYKLIEPGQIYSKKRDTFDPFQDSLGSVFDASANNNGGVDIVSEVVSDCVSNAAAMVAQNVQGVGEDIASGVLTYPSLNAASDSTVIITNLFTSPVSADMASCVITAPMLPNVFIL